jgi:hypothetical protein
MIAGTCGRARTFGTRDWIGAHWVTSSLVGLLEGPGYTERGKATRCSKPTRDAIDDLGRSEAGDDSFGEPSAPTCVTCHGASDVDDLDVTSVEQSCARCHDETRANHPEIPERARYLLNRSLSIHRSYRYIATNVEPEEAGTFFRDLDPRLQRLSVTWHTFDVDAAEEETGEVLALLKTKCDEIRKRLSEQREKAKRGDTSRASELHWRARASFRAARPDQRTRGETAVRVQLRRLRCNG